MSLALSGKRKSDDRRPLVAPGRDPFGIAEDQLFHRCGVESGARIRTGDLGAPVDLIAQALGVAKIAEVQIFHQSSAESEGLKISE